MDADIAELFRPARKTVETSINEVIKDKNYELPVDAWDCIAVVRNDDAFSERTTYSKKKRDMDFRLHIDHAQFKLGSSDTREALIYQMLLRSLQILETKSGGSSGFQKIISDIDAVAVGRNWKH